MTRLPLSSRRHSGSRDAAAVARLRRPLTVRILHMFDFGSQKHQRDSDNALRRMRVAIANQEVNAI
jgi:hypothetical protein